MTIVLDWRRHKIGPPSPCIFCGRNAICRDDAGAPCHKVCAEVAASRDRP